MKSHPNCAGCPILGQKSPIFDYSFNGASTNCDILFVSDFFKGFSSAFTKDELSQIINALSNIQGNYTYGFTAAIKCPGLKEQSINAKVMNVCRYHLQETIKVYNPKLIIACGNLAFKMLTKKSGITKYRGEIFNYEVEGKQYKVCPVFHPYAVIREPKNEPLFQIDIKNAIDKGLLGNKINYIPEYKILTKYSDVIEFNTILSVNTPIAVDIETEGFDFLKSNILTISFSYEYDGKIKTFVIPYKHKDHTWSKEEFDKIRFFISRILTSDNIKVFHNAKFDLKFLFKEGFEVFNVECSKTLAKFVDENRPIRLRDLVKEYFGVVLC